MSSAEAGQASRRNISELARSGIDMANVDTRQKYEAFKHNLTEKALSYLKEKIPEQILHFDEEVSHAELTMHDLGDTGEDAMRQQYQNEILSCLHNTQPQSTSAESVRNSDLSRKSQLKQLHFKPNQRIVELTSKVRQSALELINMIITIRFWIQMNIPRVEDGNNFGVAIQEGVVQELMRVEDSVFHMCDYVKYYAIRAKLVSKIIKYPNILDYVESVVEVDRKQLINLKYAVVELRNNYSIVYELLRKNWEKVVKPRTSDRNDFMVM